MRVPATRMLNADLTDWAGREVVMFEAVPVGAGGLVRFTFERSNAEWRQGIWVATEGLLRTAGVESAQFVLWQDTAPPTVEVEVVETDGLLRLYNVWSSEGSPGHDSQAATSGMVVTEVRPGVRRYACNDVGFEPAFDKLIFTVEILEGREN
jgi:hypothetical protein